MKLGLGLGLGSGNRPPRYVTDYFNGFELSGSTYTGGPTVVADNTGALVTSPADVLPIEGMRVADAVAVGSVNGFYDIDATEETLYTTDETKTTEWISIPSSGRLWLLPTGGTATRRRIQYKDASGTIFYDSVNSALDSVVTKYPYVYVAPTGAVTFRVYYKTSTSTATGFSIQDPTWLPTTSLGAPIHPSTPLRTRKGTVSVYGEDFKGPLIEPARTNKVTCRKANPVDTTNMAVDSGRLTDLTLVDMSEALLRSGLSHICTSGLVYRLDNSTRDINKYARCVGPAGNTQPHTMSAYICGTGKGGVRKSGVSGAGSVEHIDLTDSFVRVSDMGNTAATVSEGCIVANPYSVVYFILPQFEEGAFATSPIALDSTGADPLTALTRPAANLTRPTAGTALAALNNWGVRLRFRPTAAGQTAVLWGSYTDANNSTRIDLADSTLTYTKRLAGSNHVAQASLTHAAATLYDVIIYQHGVSGMGIAFRSWNGSAWSAWSAWATLTDANGIVNAAIASTYQIGAVNNSGHMSSNIPYCEAIAIPASVNPQAWLMAQLAQGRI